MESWQICGAGMICAVAAVIVRQMRSEMALPVRLAGGVLLIGAVLAMLYPLCSYIDGLVGESSLSPYAAILTKALGIAFMTYISAEICRDCGEPGIAGYVELAGKCEILLLSLPLAQEIIDTARTILSWHS